MVGREKEAVAQSSKRGTAWFKLVRASFRSVR
jgi:hypothetical protein